MTSLVTGMKRRFGQSAHLILGFSPQSLANAPKAVHLGSNFSGNFAFLIHRSALPNRASAAGSTKSIFKATLARPPMTAWSVAHASLFLRRIIFWAISSARRDNL
jgi:hypothetical protein